METVIYVYLWTEILKEASLLPPQESIETCNYLNISYDYNMKNKYSKKITNFCKKTES